MLNYVIYIYFIFLLQFSDCGGCWCEEWVCNYCGCLFVYHGLADPDEAAFASNIALQAYFEGRKLTIQEMNKCVEYFKDLIAPKPPPPHNLRGTTFLFRFLLAIFDFIRSVLKGEIFYRMTHPVRKNPFVPPTSETTRVYDLHTEDRVADLDRFHNKQMHDYSVPKCLGCDRWFGRRGVCFCTEDITNCFTHKKKTVAPPHETPLAYDQGEYSAADILRRVVGPPPKENVHRTGPYALGGDQSSHRLGDEESGSFAQIDMNNSTDDMTAEMARTMSVSQQPMYTPKSEYVELKRDESNDVELPV